MELSDKIAIVTGGTSGIGYATSLRMAELGAKVYACARHEKTFQPPNIAYKYLDVTAPESCEKTGAGYP